MHFFAFKILKIGGAWIDSIREFLCHVGNNQPPSTSLDLWLINIASVVAQPLHASSHSVLHEFPSLNGRIIDGLSAVCSTYTSSLLLWAKMKGVVLFWDKSVRSSWWDRFFPCAKSGVSLWVLLLSIMLTCLRSMIGDLSYLVFEWILCQLFILRLCWIKSVHLSWSWTISTTRISYFINGYQSLLTRLLPFLHHALYFPSLPGRNGPLLLLILWACVEILSWQLLLLLINIHWHGWQPLHVLSLLHKLNSDHFAWSIIEWIIILLVKD